MMKNDREYRSMELRINQEEETPSYEVKGYASTFEPYKMFTDEDGVDYYEQIAPDAFDDADLTDVVFRIDHEGAVYARTSAGTVELWTDEHGLGNRVDLSKTQKARDLYEDIKVGNYPPCRQHMGIDPSVASRRGEGAHRKWCRELWCFPRVRPVCQGTLGPVPVFIFLTTFSCGQVSFAA